MTQHVRTGYRNHRRASWGAALAVMCAFAVVVIASGSAATNTKPYTAKFDASVAGGSTTVVNVTVYNLSSQQSLGSARVGAATGTAGSIQLLSAPYMDPTQSSPPAQLTLINLNIAPLGSMTIPLTVKTPCAGGSYTWTIKAKQSNAFNGPPGNDFTFTTTSDTNLATQVTAGSCKLVWVTQPTSTSANTVITGSPYNASGTKVAVKAVDGNNNPITSASGTWVTLNQSGGTFTSSGTGFSNTSAQLDSQGIATFSGFQSDRTGSGFTFYAGSPGFVSTPDNSPSFVIANGEACTTSGCPSFNTTIDNNSNVDAGANGSTFQFLAVNPSSIPIQVTAEHGGCENYAAAGGAFEAADGRTSNTGELRFTYYLKKTAINKLYGSNSGQQFVPLCAGAAWLDASGTVRRCDDQTAPGKPAPWVGMHLVWDSTIQAGKFDGYAAKAVCDAVTGLWWGILGSFQDYTKSYPEWSQTTEAPTGGNLTIDGSKDPSVTGWDSNTTFRYFFVKVPAPLDWKMG